jgi:hypothetical protein
MYWSSLPSSKSDNGPLPEAALSGVGLGRLVTGIVGSNTARGMDVYICVSVLSSMQVEAFATDWSLVQRSPAMCLNKTTKPSAWDGKRPYKDCRATDDDDDDDDVCQRGAFSHFNTHDMNFKCLLLDRQEFATARRSFL